MNWINATLVEVANAIRDRNTTASLVLESILEQGRAINPFVNATIWVDEDGARRAAAIADEQVTAGKTLGLLHGVPLAHKDMFYQAGRPCTCGSTIRKNFTADCTATVIDRLTAAGSIAFAGLNMAEFALNPTGHNPTFGHCRNPWNTDYVTGGSSSGSAAAVAARMTYGSIGSDTSGSIRMPSSACGVTGIKATSGRVSRYGSMPLSFSADHVGPLCRNARDCARVLRVIAGYDPLDRTTFEEAVPDYEAALDGDLSGQRIGLPTNAFNADSYIQQKVRDACDVLAARGATIIPIELPLLNVIEAYSSVLSRVEGAAIHARWMRDRPQDYNKSVSARIYAAYLVPGNYYVEALSARGPLVKAFATEVFSKVDMLAMATLPMALPTIVSSDIDDPKSVKEQLSLPFPAHTRAFNYLGLPATSQPVGFDRNGLPIGLQLVGRPFAEARLLKAADAYQRDTDFHLQIPLGLKKSADLRQLGT